jgi:hypothetical protein
VARTGGVSVLLLIEKRGKENSAPGDNPRTVGYEEEIAE